MPDEFESPSESTFSPFWPLLVLVVGLLFWSGYQVYATNSQRNVYRAQFEQAKPTLVEAQNVTQHYNALMQDLVQTAGKDPAAADIAKAAIQAGVQAGLIHVQQNANGAGTGTATAPTGTK